MAALAWQVCSIQLFELGSQSTLNISSALERSAVQKELSAAVEPSGTALGRETGIGHEVGSLHCNLYGYRSVFTDATSFRL